MFIFCWNPAPFLTRKKTQENQLTWNKLIRLSLIKLYYKNFSFRYIYASYHSSFSIPSGYGIMFIHLLRKSDSKKLFGVLRTSEYSATSTKRNFRDTPNSIFFSIWVFCYDHSWITGLQGKGEGISLTPHYHFHPLHKHLDISRAITAESSPSLIGGSRTQTRNPWFPSASRIVIGAFHIRITLLSLFHIYIIIYLLSIYFFLLWRDIEKRI